jgi:cell division protein FtsL
MPLKANPLIKNRQTLRVGQLTVGQKAIIFPYKTFILVIKLDILFMYSMKYTLCEN